MIITRLRGGLGNQMFQYAKGRSLAAERGERLCLDLSWFDSSGALNPKRAYDLDLFGIHGPITNGLTVTMIKKLGHSIVEKFGVDDTQEPIHNGAHLIGSTYLDGFWQSEEHFDRHKDLIAADFKLPKIYNASSLQLLAEIEGSESVCMNVRRDDFVSDDKFVGIIYYRDAAEKMLALHPNARFYIFSDDIAWCEKNLSFAKEARIVDHSYAGEKFSNYFSLMTSCKHFIIPNSTFAWWAAWLSKSTSKMVITPKIWAQRGNLVFKKIVPERWVRL